MIKKKRRWWIWRIDYEKIAISDIGYKDINKDFEKNKNILQEIREFKNKLTLYIIESEFCGEYVKEIVDLCENVISVYTALMDGSYKNSDVIFTSISILSDYVDFLNRNYTIIVKECVDASVIESHIKELNCLVKKIISKNIVFSFVFENLENFEFI